jgi:hypothetical protein
MKTPKSKHFLSMLIVAMFVTVPVFVFGGEKITICHNPDNPKTITINENALAEHLAHGDQLGECPCPDTPCPTHVKVVNGESEPIPVTGETTVSGSVSIEGTANVNIEGTPNVNIQGTPNVNVVNDSSNPVPVIGQVEVTSQKEPVFIQINISNCSFVDGCGTVHEYKVPEGKKLTIEYFSCKSWLGNGEAISCYVRPTFLQGQATFGEDFFIQPIPVINTNMVNKLVGTGQQVKISAISYSVDVGFSKLNFPNAYRAVDAVFTLSGYLEDDI